MVTVVWPWRNRTRSFVPDCQLQELGRVMEDDSFFYLFWDCNMIVDKSALYSLEKRYLYHGEYRDVFQMYVTLYQDKSSNYRSNASPFYISSACDSVSLK